MSCCCLYLISHYIYIYLSIYYITILLIYIYTPFILYTIFIYIYILYIYIIYIYIHTYPITSTSCIGGPEAVTTSTKAVWLSGRGTSPFVSAEHWIPRLEESAETRVACFSTVNICKKNTISDIYSRKHDIYLRSQTHWYMLCFALEIWKHV